MIVFDTSILIAIERKDATLIQHLRTLLTHYPQKPCITAPTFSEFYAGYLRKHPDKRLLALKQLDKYHLLNTTAGSAKLFAELDYTLKKEGSTASPFDLLIASITLDHDKILITTDKKFQHIPNLKTHVITL